MSLHNDVFESVPKNQGLIYTCGGGGGGGGGGAMAQSLAVLFDLRIFVRLLYINFLKNSAHRHTRA